MYAGTPAGLSGVARPDRFQNFGFRTGESGVPDAPFEHRERVHGTIRDIWRGLAHNNDQCASSILILASAGSPVDSALCIIPTQRADVRDARVRAEWPSVARLLHVPLRKRGSSSAGSAKRTIRANDGKNTGMPVKNTILLNVTRPLRRISRLYLSMEYPHSRSYRNTGSSYSGRC